MADIRQHLATRSPMRMAGSKPHTLGGAGTEAGADRRLGRSPDSVAVALGRVDERPASRAERKGGAEEVQGGVEETQATAHTAAVLIAGEAFELSRQVPFVFGRAEAEGVVGLHATDMGVSAEAGSVEWGWNMWWVVNRSGKRELLLDSGRGGSPQRLGFGQRFAVPVTPLSILVPGEIFTYRLELMVPESDLARDEPKGGTSGTLVTGRITLNERDKDALVALFSPYLEDYPRRQARPLTYKASAKLLGEPWTELKVRKQVERIRGRLSRIGIYFEGAQAKYDLADHLVDNGLLNPGDLNRLKGRS